MTNENKSIKQLLIFSRMAVLFLLLAASSHLSKAQTHGCVIYDQSSENDLTTPSSACGNSIDYAPSADNPEQTPIKTIRMVWHFMCDDNGQGNFNDVDITDANHNQQSAYWAKVMNEVNSRMGNLDAVTRQDPNYPTPHIPDSRIRFNIEQSNIFYHDNTSQMNNPNAFSSHYSQYVTNNTAMTYKSDALHIFLYPAVYGSGTSWAYFNSNKVVHNGDWAIFNDPSNTSNNPLSWQTGGSLIHEIFHCLGLNHTNQNSSGGCNPTKNDGCDDTPASQVLNPCPCWNGNAADGIPCSNNVMDYNAKKRALTRCQLGKMHYGLIHNTNVNPYLIEDFCSHQASENITIQNGQTFTWENTRYLKGDLIIENGAKLTIKCFVSFANNSQVYVKAGGKLVVEGGTLTTICGSDWKGIRVEGNSSLPQNDASQGVVVLRSRAVIENARNAISLIGLHPSGNLNWSTTGGIVRANNSTFLNNRRDVEFMSYHSYATNGREYNNTSYFKKCDFLTDDNVPSTITPTAHVTMWDVNGVTFSGCIFNDQRTSGITISTDGVVGIGTLKSGFTVQRNCYLTFPCSGRLSEFINLKQAVRASGLSNPQKSVYISGSKFESYRGVELLSVNHPRVNNNTFDIEVAIAVPQPYFFPVGLYLDQSTGFIIHSNTFTGNANGNNIQFGGASGLVIRRSGGNTDKFNNNEFKGLISGSQSIGYNRDGTGTKGLIFHCNDYDNNLDDMFITKYSSDPGPHNQAGINPYQIPSSTGSKAADNEFSDQVNFLQYHIENQGSWINYIHRDPTINSRLKPVLTYDRVNTLQATGNRTCNISNNPIDINSEINIINTKRPLVEGKRNIWESSVDGGNTSARLIEIQTADPITVNTVYGDILNDAPWVSNEVLLEIAGAEAPFTNEMITDILVACPQAARSIDIQKVLDLRTTQLSQTQRDDINNELTTFTDYDNHIEEWAELSLAYQTAINNVLHEYFTDGLDHMNDLDVILKDGDNVNNYYLLAEIYYSKDMIADGDGVLAIIPNEFTLNADELNSLYDFSNYYATVNQWKLSGKDFTNLDPSDILWLETFSQSKDRVFGNSISLLKLNDASDYYGEVYVPASSTANKTTTNVENITKKEGVNIFPNPVSSELNITSNTAIQHLKIYDIAGRKIEERKNLLKGNTTINTSKLVNGIYIITVVRNGVSTSYKFIKAE